MPFGLYVSAPFCRSKCTYCNFASGVNSRSIFERYIDRVCCEIGQAGQHAAGTGGHFEREVDSLYIGGGTPTLLEISQIERLFVTISQTFKIVDHAEITIECAPGTLDVAKLEVLQHCGVNRVSLGVQSFVDRESAAVGRLHTRAAVLDDIARLRAAGITNINIDLIAGLPHQTSESWAFSVAETLATEAPHVSVYMLEVDEDSRLGRELIAGGTKYHAHFVPDDDLTAGLYEAACVHLANAGISQYEISNFARAGFESRHNLKYWTRQPYLGFGLDAHSMLPASSIRFEAVRSANPESLDLYLSAHPPAVMQVSFAGALEESFFLGLRLNRGVDLADLRACFGSSAVACFMPVIAECVSSGMLLKQGDCISLTPRGRMLSNEVFQLFLSACEVDAGSVVPIQTGL
jgi:oxygen-independent coproporphyrinogen-3 oxidase